MGSERALREALIAAFKVEDRRSGQNMGVDVMNGEFRASRARTQWWVGLMLALSGVWVISVVTEGSTIEAALTASVSRSNLISAVCVIVLGVCAMLYGRYLERQEERKAEEIMLSAIARRTAEQGRNSQDPSK